MSRGTLSYVIMPFLPSAYAYMAMKLTLIYEYVWTTHKALYMCFTRRFHSDIIFVMKLSHGTAPHSSLPQSSRMPIGRFENNQTQMPFCVCHQPQARIVDLWIGPASLTHKNIIKVLYYIFYSCPIGLLVCTFFITTFQVHTTRTSQKMGLFDPICHIVVHSPRHTRDRGTTTVALRARSLVGKAELVQVCFTLYWRDQQSK